MVRYRSKASMDAEVEAQLFGGGGVEVEKLKAWVSDHAGYDLFMSNATGNSVKIYRKAGDVQVKAGDLVTCGDDGVVRAYPADVFVKMYEPVDADEPD